MFSKIGKVLLVSIRSSSLDPALRRDHDRKARNVIRCGWNADLGEFVWVVVLVADVEEFVSIGYREGRKAIWVALGQDGVKGVTVIVFRCAFDDR